MARTKKMIRYIDGIDLPEIDRAAARTKANRRLSPKLLYELYEAEVKLPVVVELMHERGKDVEIRCMIIVDAEGTRAFVDVPIALSDYIRTVEAEVPEIQ